MENKLILGVVGIALAVIVLAGVLVPIVNDSVDTTKVYYNNDFGVLAAVTDEPVEYSIRYTGNTSGAISEVFIDNVKCGTVYNGNRAIVLADSFVILQGNSINTWYIYVGKSVDVRAYAPLMSSDISVTMSNTESIITFTTSSGVETITVPTTWCYYRDDNSTDYRIVDYTSSDKKVYVNDLSQCRGASWINTTQEFFSFEGTAVNIYGDSPETATMIYDGFAKEMRGVYSFDLGAVVGGNRATGLHFDVDNNGTPYTVNPYFLVVPNEVHGQTEGDAQYSSILLMIPLMVLVSIIMMAVGLIRSRY